MAATRTIPVVHGYVVTPEGHEALNSADCCLCHIRLDGLIFSCPDCGTVYGVLRDMDTGRIAKQDKPA